MKSNSINLQSDLQSLLLFLSPQTFKFLMPNLLMLLGENDAVAMSTIPRAAQIAKENAKQFVWYDVL